MMRSGSGSGSGLGKTSSSTNGQNKRLLKRSKRYNVSAPRPCQGKRIWGKDRRLSRSNTLVRLATCCSSLPALTVPYIFFIVATGGQMQCPLPLCRLLR
eukprot:15352158-Ditylum_brightwellii.AAC.1